MRDRLELLAREEYGDLIEKIVSWPPGLGIDVHLIGGTVVQFSDDGQRFILDQPTDREKALRVVAAVRGAMRKMVRFRR